MMFSRKWLWVGVVCLVLMASNVLAQQAIDSQLQSDSSVSQGAGDEDAQEQDGYEGSGDYSITSNFSLEPGESLPRSENSKRYHSEIEQVLAGADFAQQETVTGRRLKDVTDKETREEKFPAWIIDLVRAMEGVSGGMQLFAFVLEVLVWSLFIGAILFLLLKYRSQLQGWAAGIGRREIESELPTTLFGLDIQKDSLPDDVVLEAKNYWGRAMKRQAVATLLRASLIKLLHQHDCRFFSSDTEAECCDRIDQQAPAHFSSYLRTLVGTWQRIAYAHKDPSKDEFDNLCQQWREVFE